MSRKENGMRWIQICYLAASSASFAYGVGDTPKSTPQTFEQLRSSSLKIPLKHVPWEDKRAVTLVDEFLSAYIRLYTEFPKAFTPYDHSEVSQKALWTHLCSNRLKSICKDEEFKKKFEQLFKLDQFVQIHKAEGNSSSSEDLFKSWEKIHTLSEFLKTHFSKFHSLYFQELEALVKDSSNLESLDSLNAALEKVRNATQDAAEQYKGEYTRNTFAYPERLLLNKVFVDLIEGNFYNVETIDIIQAIATTTKSLQEQFAFDLISILASYPHDSQQTYVRGWNTSLNTLQERNFDSKTYTIWGEKFLSSEPSFSSTSHIHIPKITNQTVLNLIREFHNNDAATVDFLLHNSYQRAAWQLRDSNRGDLADKLEAKIETEFFKHEKMTSIKVLGGGAGTTYVASFEDRLRCVYKPSGLHLENPFDFFITDANYEVAASVIDRMIDLRMVPLTVRTQLAKFEVGSCQYFAENTVRARDMLQYDGTEPRKFSTASGRATKPNDVLFFDWLIGNWDRDINVDNHLLAYDGRMILIDHGYTFKPLPPLTWDHLQKMLPSERIFQKLVELDKNPKILKKALGPFLPTSRIWILTKKIHRAVKLAKKHNAYP